MKNFIPKSSVSTASLEMNHTTFGLLWSSHSQNAKRRLASADESLATAAAVDASGVCPYSLGQTIEQRRSVIGASEPLGDPHDVHRIIHPRHSFGHAVEEGSDDFSKETLEGLDFQCSVLRFRGSIVGIIWNSLNRCEQSGPIRCH